MVVHVISICLQTSWQSKPDIFSSEPQMWFIIISLSSKAAQFYIVRHIQLNLKRKQTHAASRTTAQVCLASLIKARLASRQSVVMVTPSHFSITFCKLNKTEDRGQQSSIDALLCLVRRWLCVHVASSPVFLTCCIKATLARHILVALIPPTGTQSHSAAVFLEHTHWGQRKKQSAKQGPKSSTLPTSQNSAFCCLLHPIRQFGDF